MAEKLTELTHTVAIFDPRTGLPTRDFLQSYNALVRAIRALQAGG